MAKRRILPRPGAINSYPPHSSCCPDFPYGVYTLFNAAESIAYELDIASSLEGFQAVIGAHSAVFERL